MIYKNRQWLICYFYFIVAATDKEICIISNLYRFYCIEFRKLHLRRFLGGWKGRPHSCSLCSGTEKIIQIILLKIFWSPTNLWNILGEKPGFVGSKARRVGRQHRDRAVQQSSCSSRQSDCSPRILSTRRLQRFCPPHPCLACRHQQTQHWSHVPSRSLGHILHRQLHSHRMGQGELQQPWNFCDP